MALPQFRRDLQRGEAGEAKLDEYFATWYTITPVNMDAQRRGIDRIWVDKKFKRRFTVEYKTDSWTSKSGNVFVEYVSNDKTDAPGWAVHSEAQLLVYYLPQTGEVFLLDFLKLKEHLPEWMETMQRRTILNQAGYSSLGLLVPLETVVMFCCIKKMRMPVS